MTVLPVGLLVPSLAAAIGEPRPPGALSLDALAFGPSLALQVETRPAGPTSRDADGKDPHELAPGLTWEASLRLRGEVRRDFAFGAATPPNDDDFLLSRIRLALRWKAREGIAAFLEGQDAEIHGEDGVNEDAVPNTFADDFDVHQAFVDLAAEAPAARVRIGRQKLAFGAQRLVGPLEWVNTARVWDGVRATLGSEGEATLDVFATRVVPVDPNSWNDWGPTRNRHADSDFHGVYGSDRTLLPGGAVEVYALLRRETDFDDRVTTFGARLEGKVGALALDGEFAVQGGEFGGTDHRAAAAHAGAALRVERLGGSTLGLQYNFGSGDSDPTDSVHETFDNLYPTNHVFYGIMDFFSLQNLHNVEGSAAIPLAAEVPLRISYQGFWLVEEDDDAWTNAALGVVRTATTDVDPYVGSELDLTVSAPLLGKRAGIEAGYAHFFAGDYVRDTGPGDDADFLYAQVRVVL